MNRTIKSMVMMVLALALVAIMAVVFLFMCIANGPKNHAIDLEESINAAKADITIVEKKRKRSNPSSPPYLFYLY